MDSWDIRWIHWSTRLSRHFVNHYTRCAFAHKFDQHVGQKLSESLYWTLWETFDSSFENIFPYIILDAGVAARREDPHVNENVDQMPKAIEGLH